MSGNPISGATVQAVRAGGGTWTTTTNANGIYAFAEVPSASTYTLSATVPGQTYANLTAVTGTSANNNTTSGDVWGKDFTVPATLSVQSTPPIGLIYRFEHGLRRHDELRGCRRRARDEREPGGPGGGPGRIYLLAMDAERNGSGGLTEIHHVHDDGVQDGGGASIR